jgi:hypothetical protein
VVKPGTSDIQSTNPNSYKPKLYLFDNYLCNAPTKFHLNLSSNFTDNMKLNGEYLLWINFMHFILKIYRNFKYNI